MKKLKKFLQKIGLIKKKTFWQRFKRFMPRKRLNLIRKKLRGSILGQVEPQRGKRLIITGLITILVLVGVYFLFFHSSQVLAEWWDINWHYRKAITVSNSGSAQTNYQVQLTVDTATLITAGKMQSDCDDIRITDINGQSLYHWVEKRNNACNSSSTEIWVKVLSIPTSGATIYLYYGNPSASNVENGEQTFIFFDDFNDNSISSSKWTQLSGTSWAETGGVLKETESRQTGDNGEADIYYPGGTGWTDYILEADVYAETSSYPGIMVRVNNTNISQTTMWWHEWNTASDTGTLRPFVNNTDYSWAYTWTGTTSTGIGVWRTARARVWGNNYQSWLNGVKVNDQQPVTSGHEIASGTIALGEHKGYTSPQIVWYDNIRVAKTSSTEPSTGTPAAEEKSPSPIAYWKFDEGYGNPQDSTTNNNDGTLSGPTWQTEDMCMSRKCLWFDGTDDYVEATDIDHGSTFTLEAWIKAVTISGDSRTIISKRTDNDNWPAIELLVTSAGALYGKYSTPIYGQDLEGVYTADGAITTGIWYHVAFTKSGDYTTMELYINGQKMSHTHYLYGSHVTSDVADSSKPVRIGRLLDGITWRYPFKGFIDEPKIYPYARTPAQIKADYASRGATKGSAATLSSSKGQGDYLSDGLVGYWKMDESSGNAADSSGNGNTGTWNGTGSHYPGGKFGNGGGFNGTNDYVSINDPGSSWELDVGNAVTISAWAKISSDSGGWDNAIITKDNATSRTFQLSMLNNKWAGGLWHDGSQGDHFYSDDTVSLNKWYHLIITFDGNNGYLYVNGIKQNDSISFSQSLTISDVDVEIGRKGSGEAWSYFNGTIDEVRIYNRALSAREVRHLYEWAPGPVLYLKMDEKVSGNGQTLYDISGNANHGTTYYGANASGMDCTNAGKYGSGCDFDGTDDYVSVTDTSKLNFGTGDFTLSVWVKMTGTSSQRIVNKRYGGLGMGYALVVNNGSPYAEILNASTYVVVDANTAINNDAWTHVAAIYDRDGLLAIYVNGVLKNSSSIAGMSSSDITNAIPFQIGGINNVYTSGAYLTGQIDDVRIYNYARTPKQIIEDMNAGHPSQTAPIAHWKFNEGYGAITYDSTGSGIEATGGTITEVDGYRIHTFTSSGTFTVNKGKGDVEVLVVAGGGGGSVSSNGGGGGGAGGLIYNSSYPVTASSITVTIGAGGSGSVGRGIGTNGSNSVFGSLTATGGGRGGGVGGSTGITGGSGGGGGYSGAGASGTSGQGNSGGDGAIYLGLPLPGDSGGGGGGAGQAGEDGKGNSGGGGKGGDGLSYNISGTSTYYAGGGAGATNDMNTRASGGLGGGGTGGTPASKNGNDGTINTGSGGGGGNGGGGNSGAGGSGIVVIRYPIKPAGNEGAITGADWTNAGKFGKALDFIEESDYVSVPGTFLSGLSAITAEVWIKPTALCEGTRTDWDIFLSRTDPWGYLAFNRSGNDFYPKFRLVVGGVTKVLAATTKVNVDQWYHIVGTYDGTKIRIYINGIEENSMDASGSLATVADALTIGDYSTSYHQVASNGIIDEVKIYNYALTEDDIRAEYNRGKVAVMGSLRNSSSTTWDDGGFGGNAPVAEWKFEEHSGTSAYDSSENNNTGTIIDATYTVGKIGSALSFDGNGYVNIPSNSVFNTGAAGEFTYIAWIKSSNYTSKQVIMSRRHPCNNEGHFNIYTYSNKVYLVFYSNLEPATISHYSNAILTNGETYHIAWVKKWGQTGVKLYINGILQTVNGDSSRQGTTYSVPIFIGAQNGGVGCNGPIQDYFNGKIDHVQIYNYARTPAQIAWDYNQGKPIAHYKFDKCEGTTAYDSSGNGNDGTIIPSSSGQTSVGFCRTSANTMWYNGRQGKQNSSLNFDGDDDYVDMGDPSSVLDFGTNGFTESYWIYPKTKTGNYVGHVTMTATATTARFENVFHGSNLQVYTNDGAWHDTGKTLDFNTWSHVVWVKTSNTLKLYINGQDSGWSMGHTASLGPFTSMKIGSHGGSYSSLDGQIDDVRIYNYPLTAAQIKTVYNQGAAQMGRAIEWGSSANYPGTSCNAIKQSLGSPADGVYWINPGGNDTYQVYCDMTTDGGGWTLYAYTNNYSDLSYPPAMFTGYGTYNPNASSGNATLGSKFLDYIDVYDILVTDLNGNQPYVPGGELVYVSNYVSGAKAPFGCLLSHPCGTDCGSPQTSGLDLRGYAINNGAQEWASNNVCSASYTTNQWSFGYAGGNWLNSGLGGIYIEYWHGGTPSSARRSAMIKGDHGTGVTHKVWMR